MREKANENVKNDVENYTKCMDSQKCGWKCKWNLKKYLYTGM